jgi:hypothetical protein
MTTRPQTRELYGLFGDVVCDDVVDDEANNFLGEYLTTAIPITKIQGLGQQSAVSSLDFLGDGMVRLDQHGLFSTEMVGSVIDQFLKKPCYVSRQLVRQYGLDDFVAKTEQSAVLRVDSGMPAFK